RAFHVTGVQTCALPISALLSATKLATAWGAAAPSSSRPICPRFVLISAVQVLPSAAPGSGASVGPRSGAGVVAGGSGGGAAPPRSEERRVGEECGARGG